MNCKKPYVYLIYFNYELYMYKTFVLKILVRVLAKAVCGYLTSPACLAMVATCSGSLLPSTVDKTAANTPYVPCHHLPIY